MCHLKLRINENVNQTKTQKRINAEKSIYNNISEN
jgi:hypothetical protein